MAKFPRSHGLELVGDSWIKEFKVEVLDADPEVISEGRIWYNAQEKTYKASFKDQADQLVIRIFLSQAELISTFADLTDTPNTYGAPGQVLSVNSTQDGVVWTDVSGDQTAIVEILNNRIFHYISSTPLDEYDIDHNFNTDMIDVVVWSRDDDDGLYHKDILKVTQLDLNSIRVYLTAPGLIKVIVENKAIIV